MPQAQLKKSKTGPKTPAKPYVNSSTTDRRAQSTQHTPTDTLFFSVDRSAFRPATRLSSRRRRLSLGLKPSTRNTPLAFRLLRRRRWLAGLDTWSCCAAARRTGSSRSRASLPVASPRQRRRRVERRVDDLNEHKTHEDSPRGCIRKGISRTA